jgi:hypothetical protein
MVFLAKPTLPPHGSFSMLLFPPEMLLLSSLCLDIFLVDYLSTYSPSLPAPPLQFAFDSSNSHVVMNGFWIYCYHSKGCFTLRGYPAYQSTLIQRYPLELIYAQVHIDIRNNLTYFTHDCCSDMELWEVDCW